MVVQNQSELGKGSAMPTDPYHTLTIIQPSTQPQKTQKPRKPTRKDTQVPQSSVPRENVADEAVYKDLGNSLVRDATTASSLEAEPDSGNITKTRSKATPNESSSLGTTSGGGPRRVKKLEKKRSSRTHKLKRLYKVDKDITLVNVQDDADNEMFDVNVLNVSTATTTVRITTEEITLAQSLEALKTSKPKDKGKGIMIEEPVKPMKKKVQIMLDKETALKLQVKFDEEERLAREKAEKEKEANIDLIEEWDDIQAKIDAGHQLAERLQAHEITIKELSDNMEGYKLKDLKSKGFDSIQEMFDRAFKSVNIFKDFRTELVEGKEKRTGEELMQENAKKQKVDDDKETTELKQCLEIILDEGEVTIDAIHLAVNHMLKSFSREDLEDLYKLVKAKYKSTRPVEDLDFLLLGDLKTIFEPHVEDTVWRNQQNYKVLDWKLYDSCGVHSLRMQHVHIHMLVEKKYPLIPSSLSMMLEKKLQIDYESEMAS
ncbi:hypothetical protein Tco_1072802 [Tanacetum coccineum]